MNSGMIHSGGDLAADLLCFCRGDLQQLVLTSMMASTAALASLDVHAAIADKLRHVTGPIVLHMSVMLCGLCRCPQSSQTPPVGSSSHHTPSGRQWCPVGRSPLCDA